jgi:hypothetical protein
MRKREREKWFVNGELMRPPHCEREKKREREREKGERERKRGKRERERERHKETEWARNRSNAFERETFRLHLTKIAQKWLLMQKN